MRYRDRSSSASYRDDQPRSALIGSIVDGVPGPAPNSSPYSACSRCSVRREPVMVTACGTDPPTMSSNVIWRGPARIARMSAVTARRRGQRPHRAVPQPDAEQRPGGRGCRTPWTATRGTVMGCPGTRRRSRAAGTPAGPQTIELHRANGLLVGTCHCACGAFTDRTGRWVGRNSRKNTPDPAGLRRDPETPQPVRARVAADTPLPGARPTQEQSPTVPRNTIGPDRRGGPAAIRRQTMSRARAPGHHRRQYSPGAAAG